MVRFRLPSRRALFVASLALLAGAGCLPLALGQPITGSSVHVPLDPQNPQRRMLDRLIFRGGLVLTSAEGDFGGLSGLRVNSNGRGFVAISDRGSVITGRLSYGDDGDLNAADDLRVVPLSGADGRPLDGTYTDAEGLTRLADGSWAVSFERRHRIERYAAAPAGPAGRPIGKPLRPSGIGSDDGNSGLETITALADGRLLTIEEGEQGKAGLHRAWLGGADGWDSLTYRSEPPFVPVDAATMPSGDVLILEREASFLTGFGNRIVRVLAADIRRGAVLRGQELARLQQPLTTDNFEGISAIPGPNGSTLIHIVSDDNFWMVQRTLLLMFELPAG
jgi:hypothetical protein